MKNWQITGILVILTLGFLFMCGCTSMGSTSSAPVATPTITVTSPISSVVTTQPTIQVTATVTPTPDIVERKTPSYLSMTLYQEACGKMYYCLYGNNVVEFVKPVKNNCYAFSGISMDQGVNSCTSYLNARSNYYREELSCTQGMGELDYCLHIADKHGISREIMKKMWCQTNTC